MTSGSHWRSRSRGAPLASARAWGRGARLDGSQVDREAMWSAVTSAASLIERPVDVLADVALRILRDLPELAGPLPRSSAWWSTARWR